MTEDYGFLNLLINLANIVGLVLVGYIALQSRRVAFEVRQMTSRIESVIAPKTGIENHLLMCAQVVEDDPDGTCIVSDDGQIVLVNKRLEAISGYHRSELVGQPVEILVPEAMRGGHAQYREGFTTEPSSRPMRGLALRHKRGRDIPVEIRLNHYIDSAGGFTIAKVRVHDDDWRKSGDFHRAAH